MMNLTGAVGSYSKLSPEEKAFVEKIPFFLKTPAQLEDELLREIAPKEFDSDLPADKIRIADLRRRLQIWIGSMLDQFRDTVKRMEDFDKRHRGEVEGIKKDREAWAIREAELKRDLASAQELRGTYESKRVTELEGKLNRQALSIKEALDKLNAAEATITQLQAEITGKDVRADGYERSIQELTTAAAENARINREQDEAMQLSIEGTKAHLLESIELIEDRWGPKAGPYVDAIKAEISQALAQLSSYGSR